ncbi:hypothetical protein ACFYVL_09490 [Streptomyces sp. NPDC004111]|uniref:hypothetical protein n=1 Tax=Streptomyces sp. NPDC004111 TaxID=3364690 RepID=UPI0036925847
MITRKCPRIRGTYTVAVLVPLLMGRTHKERGLTLLATVPVSFLAYLVIDKLILTSLLGA